MDLKSFKLKKVINQFPVCFILLSIIGACQKEPVLRFGFDTAFKKNATGISVMYIGKNALAVDLTGDIILNEGQVLVELINSAGDTVFASQIITPGNFSLDKSFSAVSGNWKLKYRSIEGIGSLKVHVTTRKEN